MRPAFALIVSILLSGCASSARINQFQAFAELGHRHQVALGSVIDQAVASNIDANSQELLDIREQKVPAKSWGSGPSGDEILDTNNLAVIETTRQYAAIKRHAALLDEYFQKLGALAAYDSQPIANSTSATVEAIQALSPKLQAMKGLPAAAGAVAQVVVNGVKGRLLERELRTNGDVIHRELALQERVLVFIAARIAADQDLLTQRKILDRLAVPFGDLNQPDVPGDWIAARRELLLSQAVAAEPAEEAARLSRQLRRAYLQLLEGKLTPEDVSSLASDLSRLLALIDVVTSKPAGGGQ